MAVRIGVNVARNESYLFWHQQICFNKFLNASESAIMWNKPTGESAEGTIVCNMPQPAPDCLP